MLAREAFIVERSKFRPRCHSGRKPSCISMFSVLLQRTSWGEHVAVQQDYDVPALRLAQELLPCRPTDSLTFLKLSFFVTETVCWAPQGRQSRACVGERAL